MRWHTVVSAMKAVHDADATLTATLGAGNKLEPIESGATRRVPSVRYMVPVDVEEEVMNPITVQLDYWAINRAQAVVIESRLRALYNHPVRRPFGGLDMETSFDDARDSSDPDVGVVHRQLDFRFVPVKRRIPL